MAGPPISGTAVGVITAGVVLVYAGFRGLNPLAALRDLTSGRPTPIADTAADLDTGGIASSGVNPAIAGATGAAANATGFGAMLVRAAQAHANEKYSQTRRWQVGYSDCSSFVGKSLRDIGIAPPGMSLAANYVTWSKLAKIPRSQLGVGDLCANINHVIIATGNNSAIGQENPALNVQRGTPENLMSGSGAFICLRYRAPVAAVVAPATAGAVIAGAS